MELGISGKRVLITGANQGLGRVAALDFAREGCRVAAVSRDEARLRNLLEELGGEAFGHTIWACDLMDPGAPLRALEGLQADRDPFDIVINNVGGTLSVKNPLSDCELWERVWRFNVGIAIEINNAVIPRMLEKGEGRIIHVSSISAESVRGSTPYAAAKAYLNAYVKGVGRSFAPNGIVMSAVMPGSFDAEGGHWDHIRKNNPAMMEDFLRHHHAIGRLGTPEEISPFLLFLASKYVTFATAAVIPVDGGTM
jgi:3-oxoacyl-[acyl-carrier protein] reductase